MLWRNQSKKIFDSYNLDYAPARHVKHTMAYGRDQDQDSTSFGKGNGKKISIDVIKFKRNKKVERIGKSGISGVRYKQGMSEHLGNDLEVGVYEERELISSKEFKHYKSEQQ